MIRVTENIWRGPRPKDIRELASMGIKRIISLQSGAEEVLTDTPYEIQSKVADRYGIEFVLIPCSNIFPPTTEQTALATLLLCDDIPTFVHCHSGVDRTGFIIEAFQMTYQGKTFADAQADWVAMGRHWWFGWWKFALKQWTGKAG